MQSLKLETIKIILLLIIQLSILAFIGIFLFSEDYLPALVLGICLAALFILIRIKGKKMKKEFPEAYE